MPSATPITLAANASCTLAYVFTPTVAGPASQTLTVTANVPGSGTIALSGMGLHLGMEVEDWPPENIEELAKKYEDHNG